MTKALLIAAAVALTGTSAQAGIYVNPEINSAISGSKYGGSVIDLHVGYELSPSENSTVFIQAGPSLLKPDGIDGTTEFSGKAGFDVGISDKLSGYGEVSFQTVEDFDNQYGLKGGLKYAF